METLKTDYYENAEKGIHLTVNIGSLANGHLLDGRIVFITGATQGIGLAMAKAFLSQGAKVIINGRSEEKVHSITQELGDNCAGVCFDLRNVSKYDVLIEEVSSCFGLVNCLVNNAGISRHEGDFMNVTESDWDAQIDINLKSPFFLTQAWLRYYQNHQLKNGHLLMMASDTSGMGSSIPYGISKAGIASLTRGLAKKLITEGIRVNALAPGTTLTPMTEDFTHGEVCRDTTIGKRALFPEEIAQTAVFLLSDLSSCISGNIFGCSEGNICFDNPYNESETNP